MHNKNLMRKITTYILALVSVVTIFTSCKKEYETVEELDDKNIQTYKAANSSLSFTDTAGYSYAITEEGSGAHVLNSDSVYYSYAFKSITGAVYNQTSDLMIPGTFLGYTDQFAIGSTAYLFKPVREVLAKLKRGGRATLLLPSRMAFGKNGLSNFGIGSNETIVVELGLYTYEKRHEVDGFEISTFIARNNLTLATDPSGVKFNINAEGTGTDVITEKSTVVVNYTVRSLDGLVLEAATGYTTRLDMPGLYKGWTIMIPKLTSGGKMRMVLPTHLGQGRPLDFDIEVTSVTND
ncbi:FKBP-type peptidyl-prolyl cis-trans isomerase [Pedobacter sp. SL55]|uniref:FKBP-type peptidyl-prolyl cis-trans isomerase n=1 Tax=Pedobacter sp. SL55 TaxID=2995161 RepID=UPI00227110B1|nr:hypothetical protein [Pedobacter sp. SL55]WAC42297.1 hypothetical protein OVA16_08065 [Pedobacter sp. SL55]